MSIRLTPELARAAGWDAGNRSMRAAGRKAWNEEDYQAAVDTENRLMQPLCIRCGEEDMLDSGFLCDFCRLEVGYE